MCGQGIRIRQWISFEMGGGKKKPTKKSPAEQRRAGAAAPQTEPVVTGAPVQDEASLAIQAAVALYSRPVQTLSAHLSHSPLKENELCRKFDVFISSESSMPEVGIQSARDLFVEVSKRQQLVLCRHDVLKAQKDRLVAESVRIREKAVAAADDIQKGIHQKEVLAALADELTKQKNVRRCVYMLLWKLASNFVCR